MVSPQQGLAHTEEVSLSLSLSHSKTGGCRPVRPGPAVAAIKFQLSGKHFLFSFLLPILTPSPPWGFFIIYVLL